MTSSDYRRIARERLTGNWPLAIGVAAAACILGGLVTGSSFVPQFNVRIEGQDISNIGDLLNLLTAQSISAFGLGSILGLAQFLIGGAIELGFATFLLRQHRREALDFQDLFSQFHRFGQGFAQKFLRILYITLWSLLFVIPGIVKSYAYAMTPFIMAENPELSANDAITASRELMDGHKGDLFILDLSFIGWGILAAVTCNIGHLALNPYRNAAYAAFYKDLTTQK